jgi:hypothetical protein
MGIKKVGDYLNIKKISLKTIFTNNGQLIRFLKIQTKENFQWNEDTILSIEKLWRNFLSSVSSEINFLVISSPYSNKKLTEYKSCLIEKFREEELDKYKSLINYYLLNVNQIIAQSNCKTKELYVSIKITPQRNIQKLKIPLLIRDNESQQEKAAIRKIEKYSKNLKNLITCTNYSVEEVDDYGIHQLIYKICNLKEI